MGNNRDRDFERLQSAAHTGSLEAIDGWLMILNGVTGIAIIAAAAFGLFDGSVMAYGSGAGFVVIGGVNLWLTAQWVSMQGSALRIRLAVAGAKVSIFVAMLPLAFVVGAFVFLITVLVLASLIVLFSASGPGQHSSR